MRCHAPHDVAGVLDAVDLSDRLADDHIGVVEVVGWGHLPLAGDFPNPGALLRLAGAVLVEAHDEWQVSDRRYLSEGSMALLDRPDDQAEEAARPALTAS